MIILNIIILSIISIILYKEKYKKINIIISIIQLDITLYLYLIMNNNNIEYIYRKESIGIDSISISILILINIIYPIIYWISKEDIINVSISIIYTTLILIFISIDIFYFFITFELLLIPMFILIVLLGSPNNRIEAGYRFFLYTYLGSLSMLIGILLLYLYIGSTTLDILLYTISTTEPKYIYVYIGILIYLSLLIKLPIYPFHIWLPIVHVESPTIGSILLAGILLKIATYGIYRFNIPILGIYNSYLYLPIYILILISVYYTAYINIRQIDLKKIIAYSSIVHMNYTLFGLLSNDIPGLYGALYSNISHGIVSSSLFILIGILYIRYHTRILYYYSNIATYMPIYSIFFFIFILHNMAIPTSSSFISEINLLISTYKVNIIFSILLICSILLTTIYNMWLMNRLLYNNNIYIQRVLDLSYNESIILTILLLISFLLGIFPSSLLSSFSSSILLLLY